MKFGDDPFQLMNPKVRYQALDERSIESGGLLDKSDESILQLPQLHRPFLAILVLEVGKIFSVLLDDPVMFEPHPPFNILLLCEAEILKDDCLICLLQSSGSRASAQSNQWGRSSRTDCVTVCSRSRPVDRRSFSIDASFFSSASASLLTV